VVEDQSRKGGCPHCGLPEEDAVDQKKRVHPMAQTAVVVGLLVVGGGAGYFLRSDQLARQAAASASPDQPLGDLSLFKGLVKDMQAAVRAGDLAEVSRRLVGPA
jgi:hypothetical protein